MSSAEAKSEQPRVWRRSSWAEGGAAGSGGGSRVTGGEVAETEAAGGTNTGYQVPVEVGYF
jgi:hypothetical protein